MEKFHGYKTKLQFAGKHSQLDGSLVWSKPIAQAIHWKIFAVILIDLQKPQNFSSLDDLQYVVTDNEMLLIGCENTSSLVVLGMAFDDVASYSCRKILF